MFLSTEGIILKKVQQPGNGYIIKVYTQVAGIKSYFARKSKKQKGLFQPLTILNISAYEHEKKTIQNTKEVSIAQPYLSIHGDIIKSNICVFLNEVLEKVIQEEEPNPSFYAFLKKELLGFDSAPLNLDFHALFLMRLTQQLGFKPNCSGEGYFNFEDGIISVSRPMHVNYFTQSETLLFKEIHDSAFNNNPLNSNNTKRKKIIELLIQYYNFHTGLKNIKSLPILQMVFS